MAVGAIRACHGMNLDEIPSPAFVVDLGELRKNCAILDDVQTRSGAEILLALKGFSMWSVFPLLRKHLCGTCASSIDEARLGFEEFGPRVHAYAPAYKDEEIDAYIQYCSHISFNSLAQWNRHRPVLQAATKAVSPGFRINPEHREVEVAIYDPCGPCSRLGIRAKDLHHVELDGIEGLHFHNLCEKNADALSRTLSVVEKNFGELITQMKWINLGGGHHITREDYNIELLVKLISDFKSRYNVDVILEPGEAIALNTGVLVATVMDIVENDMSIAILDTSASAHMPDVLEMPYRPVIAGAGNPGECAHTYRLGGMTCLAGDIIGDYSFAEPLRIGQRLIFGDMAHYSMVKTTTFNGIRLPSICTYEPENKTISVIRSFGYDDFKQRLS